MKKERIVIALGGNALQSDTKDISAEAQLRAAKITSKSVVDLVEEGHELVIVHGNGPQVGQIVSTYEQVENIPTMPFPECGAMSQGYIGYHVQQCVREEMLNREIDKNITTIVTQVVVDENDKGFTNPIKPVGSFFNEEEAKALMKEKGYHMKEDSGRGWRRVVASPEPVDIVEATVIKELVSSGNILITAGGGGIPVIKDGENGLKGVPAVIDKDFAAEKVAEIIDADYLIILTAVEKVAINFNKPNQEELDVLTLESAQKYIEEGHFAPGSMLPKVKAAMKFVKSKPGRKALITSLEKANEGIAGQTGTVIVNDKIMDNVEIKTTNKIS